MVNGDDDQHHDHHDHSNDDHDDKHGRINDELDYDEDRYLI